MTKTIVFTDASQMRVRGTEFGAVAYGFVSLNLDGNASTVWGTADEQMFSNNQGEAAAIREAATQMDMGDNEIHIFSDSLSCVEAFNAARNGKSSKWVRRNNMERIVANKRVSVHYVPGHNGSFYNELADAYTYALANGTEAAEAHTEAVLSLSTGVVKAHGKSKTSRLTTAEVAFIAETIAPVQMAA